MCAANPRGAGARSLAEGAGKGRRRATNRHCRGEGEKKGWRRGNARRERRRMAPAEFRGSGQIWMYLDSRANTLCNWM
uniref:Uncharacterized protein n=1 Tax=Ursus americanus TaxID=9643 RepID=A0A452RIK6_URSAM